MSAKEFVDALENDSNLEAEDAFKKARRYDRRQVRQLQDWANDHFKSSACKSKSID